MKPMVFIYIKDGMFQCLNEYQHKQADYVLLERGWKHSATIDASLWLESFLNRGETGRFERIEEISK